MPPVRTSTAAPLQVTGSTGPRASAPSFGASASGLAQGLAQLPSGLAAVAGAKQRGEAEAADFARGEALQAKKDFEDSQKLARFESSIDLDVFAAEWVRDESTPGLSANDARTALESKVDEVVAERGLQGDYAREFKARSREWVSSNLIEHEVARKGRADNDFNLRVGRAIDAGIRRYYNDGDGEMVLNLRDQVHRQIAEKYDDNQSQVLLMRKKYDTVIAKAMIDVDPENAEQFISETSYIDADNRGALIQKAKLRATTKDVEAAHGLTKDIARTLASALQGDDFKLPEQQFTDVHGEKGGKAAFKVYSMDWEINRKAYDVVDMYAGMNPAAIEKAKKAAETAGDVVGREAHYKAYAQLQESLKYRKGDPVLYQTFGEAILSEHEADAEAAREKYELNPNNATLHQWMDAQTALNQNRLDYQGYGSSPYHLKLPSYLRSLLPNERAKMEADRIKKAKPEEVADVWKSIFQEFPDAQHQWIVFDDIAAQGLDFEHIMGFFVRDEPFAQTFIQAQREKNLKPADGTREQFVAGVRASDEFQVWAQGQRAVGAREEYISGAANAIANYAMVISNRPDPGDAVGVAVTNMFGWLKGIEAGDNIVSIDTRKVPLESLEVLEEFLPEAIQRLDLEDIHPGHFEDEVGLFNKQDRDNFVNSVVTGEGATWLAATTDGKRIQLMGISGPGGDITVVEDSNGVPYSLHIDDLPKGKFPAWEAPQGGLSNWPFKPEKTVDPVAEGSF